MITIKNALWLAAPLALAACASESGTSSDEGEMVMMPEPEAAAVMQPGLYAVGDGTQVYSRTRLNEDGSYVDLNDAGEQVGGGSWRQMGEEICFDPEGDGEDQGERCWTQSAPGDDGSFTTTRVDGSESYTVTPMAE
jgi:hypothetical protein